MGWIFGGLISGYLALVLVGCLVCGQISIRFISNLQHKMLPMRCQPVKSLYEELHVITQILRENGLPFHILQVKEMPHGRYYLHYKSERQATRCVALEQRAPTLRIHVRQGLGDKTWMGAAVLPQGALLCDIESLEWHSARCVDVSPVWQLPRNKQDVHMVL